MSGDTRMEGSATDPVRSPTGSISNSSFQSIKSVSNSTSGEHTPAPSVNAGSGEGHMPHWGLGPNGQCGALARLL